MVGMAVIGGLKKRRPVLRISGGLLVLLLFLQMACTSGSSDTTPQPTNYTVTVTASAGAIQNSTQVAVTLQ